MLNPWAYGVLKSAKTVKPIFLYRHLKLKQLYIYIDIYIYKHRILNDLLNDFLIVSSGGNLKRQSPD